VHIDVTEQQAQLLPRGCTTVFVVETLKCSCSWSLEMVPLESLGAISHSIATMAVSYDMIRL